MMTLPCAASAFRPCRAMLGNLRYFSRQRSRILLRGIEHSGTLADEFLSCVAGHLAQTNVRLQQHPIRDETDAIAPRGGCCAVSPRAGGQPAPPRGGPSHPG